MTDPSPLEPLLALSKRLGMESRGLAILGEGNTSAKISDDRFLVKASGSKLATLESEDVVECHSQPLLELLKKADWDDEAVDAALFDCRVDATAKKPSVEALFHAWLLSLPDIRFVGHAHPVKTNRILCSDRAGEFASQALFPDQIVCCGPRAVLVPYTDPGFHLAVAIRDATVEYIKQESRNPRLILLVNHGAITLGPSAESVEAAMLMCEKAADIFWGAAALAGPRFLSRENVERIGGRPDEHYRQKALNL